MKATMFVFCFFFWYLRGYKESLDFNWNLQFFWLQLLWLWSNQVHQVKFWMRNYLSPSMKPTMVITNKQELSALDVGPVPKKRRMRAKSITRKYRDARGKQRFCGTPSLKRSQLQGWKISEVLFSFDYLDQIGLFSFITCSVVGPMRIRFGLAQDLPCSFCGKAGEANPRDDGSPILFESGSPSQ